MKLSVVILNYNVRHFLELCLQSVVQATKNVDAEIIVVDNNSPDDSCKMVEKLFPEVILVKNRENVGFSKGNNLGVKRAKGDYICILNPDTVVAEDTFETLLKFTETKTDMGIVGCRLIDGTGAFLPESKRNVPTPKVSVSKILGNDTPYYANHIKETQTAEVDILVGAFMLIKLRVYNELNGFDEAFFMYGEDIDLSYRATQAGYKNYYAGSTTVIHFKGESTLKDRKYAQDFYKAMQIFYKKHFRNRGLFDVAVWFGTTVLPFIKTERLVGEPKPKKYVLVSLDETFQKRFNKTFQQKQELEILENHTEYILDSRLLSFKIIIGYMASASKKIEVRFKIIPKTATFILGSNSSKNRGEVFHLE